MAIALRAASNGTATGTSWPITYPTGSVVGDYVFVVLGLGNATGSFNAGPFGDMALLSTDTNSGDTSGYYTAVYGGRLTSTTGPTITSTSSGNKGAWVAIAFSGSNLTLDGTIAKTLNTTTSTSHTPPAKTAGQASVASVLLHSSRNSATGATGPTATPPTNWIEPANGDAASSGGTTNANRNLGCEVSYRLAQSGTITPGSLTISLTGYANLYHALLYEAAGSPVTVTPAVVAGTAAIPSPTAGRTRSFTFGAVTSGQATGLSTGQQYRAIIRARDAAGNWSAWTAPVTFATLAAAPAVVAATAAVPAPTVSTGGGPLAPAVLPGVAAIPAPGVVAGRPAPAVVAAVAAVPAPPAGRVRTFSFGAVTTGQVTGLTGATTYSASIRARDAAGNWSALTAPVTFSTTGAPVTPATLAGAAAIPGVTTSGGSAATVTPGVVAAAAAIPAVAAGRVRSFTFGAVTTGQVTGLTAGSNYSASIRARDAAGNWSAYSAPVTFTTNGAGTAGPGTVAAVATIPGPTVGGASPTVTAGRSRPVANGQGVLLDVTATAPASQTIVGYSWAIQSGLGTLSNATTATPTYTAPASGNGTAVIRGTVFVSGGGNGFADVTVAYHATVVAAENTLTGTARGTWDLASPNLGGVSTLQGFADGFSFNRTETVQFKIAQSDTAGWTGNVYRLGYYAGNGARDYGPANPSAGQVTSSQAQPAPADADASTTLLSADCAAWSTTLTWTPPTWAPSGIYILRINRTGGGASHVMFILRDDTRRAALALMPSDSTWNAYNAWGGMGAGQYAGNSLYFGTAIDQYNADAARFVSYNRPVVNRGSADAGRTYGAVEWSTFFTGEYPMVRFLERNGYDVKYYSCLDAAGDFTGTHLTGNGSTRGGAGAGMFIGHNEYWSDGMRAGWEAAKAAGVHVFSCASNEVFWRLVGTVPDSAGRPRTWECQKSTINGRGSTRPEWTGTWRDPDGAGKGGNNPENTFTGTIFVVNGPDLHSLVVPFAGGYSAQPLWRDTSVAALTTGQSYTSPAQIIGFEWDTYGPAGVNTTGAAFLAAPHAQARYCSNVTYSVASLVLTDAGDVYGAGNVTHRLVVHPGGNGSIVFGTGTINWALGVDNSNTYQQGNDNTDIVIQQATVNMLADMGAPPGSLMAGLTTPTPVEWFVNRPLDTVAASAAVPVPAIATTTGYAGTPAAVAAVTAVPTPTRQIGWRVSPAVVAAAAALPAPTVRAGTTRAPLTLAGLATFPAVTAGGTDTAAPTKPINLQITATSTTTIDISWDPSTDNVAVTGYEVRVQPAAAVVPAFGHTADPLWPGSFTGGTHATTFQATTGNTYSYRDFRAGVDVGTSSVAANNVTFRGCRFQYSENVSNQGNNSSAQVLLFGDNVTFEYCTFQPFTSNYPTELTGEEINGQPATYVEYGKGYQYAIVGDGGFNTHIGDLLIDHCDFWGFGNALQLAGSTLASPHIVRNSWFHHGADPFVENQTANQFHNDCWLVNDGGYHGARCQNNVMEIWGNTNLLAWQGAGAYNDSTITGNRFSGDQESISLSASGTSARITFTDNVFSTRIGRAVGSGKPLRSWSVSDSGTGSLWRRNTYLVAPTAATGNYPGANWGSPTWSGQYWHPGDTDSTGGHAADYTG